MAKKNKRDKLEKAANQIHGANMTNAIVSADYASNGNVPVPNVEQVKLAKGEVDKNHK